MANTIIREPIRRLHSILDDNPELKGRALMEEYSARYGINTSWATVERAKALYGEMKPKAEAAPPVEPTKAAKRVEEEDSSYVPKKLLDTIGIINEAVNKVGGPERALALAESISKAGGVKNFARAVTLLQTISPQVSPEKPRGPQENPD